MCAWAATAILIITIIATYLVPPNPETITKKLQEYTDKVCAEVWFDYKHINPSCIREPLDTHYQ